MKKILLTLLICASLVLVACSPSSGTESLYYVTSDGAISCARGKSLRGDITIPKNVNGQDVKTIANRGFEECKEITSITIPEGISEIGKLAFIDCTSLKSITIPDSVTEIGKEAFSGCRALESITVPSNVETIHATTFKSCGALTAVNLGEKLTAIESIAFEGCSALSSITIPASVKRIDAYAFNYCNELKDIHYSLTKADWTNIEKDDNWWEPVWFTDTLIIHCSDGDITLSDGSK